jgi:hypothetical protein
MANVGLLVVGVRANYSDLARDMTKAGDVVKGFKTRIAAQSNLGPAMDSHANLSRIKSVSGLARKAFDKAGLGMFADLAGDIGFAAKSAGTFGVVAGASIAAAAVAVGALAAGFEAIRRTASSAMSAVDAAFKIGDRSKTLEALQKIIDAGSAVGLNITLADTQKVQAINESIVKLEQAMLAVGVQIVSDFQPEIMAVLEGMKQVVIAFADAAEMAGRFAKPLANSLNTGVGKGAIAAGLQQSTGIPATFWSGVASKVAKVGADIANKPAFAELPGIDKSKSFAFTAPAALEMNTASQYSASLAARNTPEAENPVVAEAKKQTEEQKRTNALLWSIDSALSERAASMAMVGI